MNKVELDSPWKEDHRKPIVNNCLFQGFFHSLSHLPLSNGSEMTLVPVVAEDSDEFRIYVLITH